MIERTLTMTEPITTEPITTETIRSAGPDRKVDPVVRGTRRANRVRQLWVRLTQLAILVAFLALWQWLPSIGFLRAHVKFLDPYFISSPSQTASTLLSLMRGTDGYASVWPAAWSTAIATLVGTAVGTVLGAVVGLITSNFKTLSDILRPFILALNAVPRIALIPIIVIMFGPTKTATITTAVTVVFFLVFFNAFEGGRSVRPEILENARILGAKPLTIMWQVRRPYTQAWTIASLPNAVSFGLVAVVTAELLTGTNGMGRVLLESVTTVQSSLTFAVVVILSVFGLVLVALAELLRRYLLHWWSEGASS
jgi:NitT/TauT family transport system permease protein